MKKNMTIDYSVQAVYQVDSKVRKHKKYKFNWSSLLLNNVPFIDMR